MRNHIYRFIIKQYMSLFVLQFLWLSILVHYGDVCETLNECEGGATCTELVGEDVSRCLCPADTLWDYKLHACVHIFGEYFSYYNII